MRRFYGLLVLLLVSLPFSVGVAGCKHAVSPTYCPGFSDSGPVAGQATTISFNSTLTSAGESLNYGQIGPSLTATAADCFGNSVALTAYTYGTSNMSIADINPNTGQVCAGTFNRNTGGGVADYSICTPPTTTPLTSVAYVTASASGVTSNPIPVYVHPVVTSVAIGNPTSTTSCAATTTITGNTVAGSNIVSVSSTAGITVGQTVSGNGIPVGTTITAVSAGTLTLLNNATITATGQNFTGESLAIGVADPSSNCCPADASLVTTTYGPYTGTGCVSQNQTAQLVSRVYSNGDTLPIHNITCQAGHITYTPQSSSDILTIDANGIATAVQPGSTTIVASVSSSGSGSTAGFFSTCPPQSIVLSTSGATTVPTSISVAQNNVQSLNTTVLDTNGNTITGLPLVFVSTSPQTLSVGGSSVTPSFPGSGTITAVCQPGTCNPSPFSQIGYLGNGKPITSNGIVVNTAGTSSNQVIVASTQSEFFYSVDFTTSSTGATYKLPFIPNSMVITVDGSTLYLGSTNVLMSITASNLSVNAIGAIPGIVLAVSPDAGTLVIADPTRGVTSLYSSGGTLLSTYNGVGTRAQWSPDSTTVYIAAGNLMLVHSTFTGWTSTPVTPNYQDVAVAVPAYGAYFAGTTETDGRSYCATSTNTAPSSPPPAVVNTFYPLAQDDVSPLQRVAATNDGAHILGEGFGATTATAGPNLYDLVIAPPTSSTDQRLACTTHTAAVSFASTDTSKPLPIPTASTFMGVVPASNSSIAFVNYALQATTTTPTYALPYYFPATATLSSIKLSGTATAPVAGVFSSDNTTFYTTTSGDNALHIIGISGTTVTDSSTILPNLQNNSGTVVTPNLIAARVKKSTS